MLAGGAQAVDPAGLFGFLIRSEGSGFLTAEKKFRAACSGVASSFTMRVTGRPRGRFGDSPSFEAGISVSPLG